MVKRYKPPMQAGIIPEGYQGKLTERPEQKKLAELHAEIAKTTDPTRPYDFMFDGDPADLDAH